MRPEKTGLYGRSGHVLLTRERDGVVRYALAIRSHQKRNWPGHLDFTAGGSAVAGESALDAAVREAKEELGVELAREELQEIDQISPARGYHSFGAVFACAWGAPLAEKPGEVEGFLWFTAAQLSALRYGSRPMKPDLSVYAGSLVML
jgi:8-oxo-dGTP pyrophosphatase MutT (NUDIX family)